MRIIMIILLLGNAISVVIRGNMNKTEYLYEIPSQTIKGVVFLAHGCSHSATDWWISSSDCPNCIGLPIERSIVQSVLSHGYIALAISSRDRQSKCWSQKDGKRVADIISHLYHTVLNDDFTLSLHMIGASSGGSFVGYLARSRLTRPLVSSLAIQIMGDAAPVNLPPTLFLLMSKDIYTMERVKQSINDCSNCNILPCREVALYPNYFHDRSHGVISTAISNAIFNALNNAGYLTLGYILKEEPRSSSWREVCYVIGCTALL